MTTHSITALKIDTTTIDGIVSSAFDTAIELFLAGSDSHPHNSKVAPSQQRPTAAFSLLKLASAINEFGIDGYEIDASPLDIYTVDNDQGGGRAATGEKLSISKAIIVPSSLTLTQGEWSTIAYDVFMGGTDGVTCPYANTSDQTPPTRSAISELFTLGPVELNSASFPGVTRVEVDFGFSIEQVLCDGLRYPVQVYIGSQQPVITIDTFDPAALETVGEEGTTNLITFQATKIGAGTGHKVFSTHLNFIGIQSRAGEHRGRAVTSVLCTPVWDGTNAPITVA